MASREIFDYLVQDDNLQTALEVHHSVEEFTLEMHRKFWAVLREEINHLISLSEYSKQWKYQPHPATSPKKNWATSYLVPLAIEEKPQLRIGLGQTTEKNNFRLYWGVEWNKEPKSIDQTILIDLRNSLFTRGITKTSSLWIGWNYLDYNLYAADNLIRLYTAPVEYVQEIAEKYWAFFREIESQVSKVNSQI